MAATVNKLVTTVSKNIPVLVEKSKPKLRKFMYYAKVEMVPPNPTEIPQIIQGFAGLFRGLRTSAWRKVTVKQAWVNTLITTEVICWFFVGEVIGKRKLVGYKV